jgi:hypothetical protein
MYKVPDEFFFRLHHVRPRFKNNVEEVLLFVCQQISSIDEIPVSDFEAELFSAIKKYPENIDKAKATINNWRTEISALFGLVEYTDFGTAKPSYMAKKLAKEQDLVQFFKYFVFKFQYPGGFLRPDKIIDYINNRIKFKPGKYILEILAEGEKLTGKRFPINKSELAHVVFNDKRVTNGTLSPKEIAEKLILLRNRETDFDWNGDVVRYAGDILDYMEIANLLVSHGNVFYLNKLEVSTIKYFIDTDDYFAGYDNLYEKTTEITRDEVRCLENEWFKYVNKEIDNISFKTDISLFLAIEQEIEVEVENKNKTFRTTKDIGDFGESLVYEHEKAYLRTNDRDDLIHLVKRIPTHQAQGYDIQSVEVNAIKKLIEVKTTISNRALQFYRVHLTPNEWNAAETHGDNYFIYRVGISKENDSIGLFVIKNPVDLYKKSMANMSPIGGADMVFNSSCGSNVEMLKWS